MNLLLNLPFFIFCNKKFFENLVFLTDTVADLAVRYTFVRALYFVRPLYVSTLWIKQTLHI
jgi:hypothetical protein